MQTHPSSESLPPLVSTLISPLPKPPMEALLSTLTRRLVARRPDLIRRLGDVVRVPIAIVPDDLPHAFLLSLDPDTSRVRICDKSRIGDASAIVRAPFLVLLGLLDGTYDGDALFFSRDLRIEGRTEHVLALRNTLEEADLTPGAFFGLGGRSADWVNALSDRLLGQVRAYAQKSKPAAGSARHLS
ncbi:ubiquinone anaerobic biosynthesis accessory factor UbiT [Roseibium sediminicola]|uniref:SCP2 sterol-binding domain-containing protein n=1 Tax=Roseibium sediminicola TaxID=2933272 RepID=A0ABT0GNY4_9HYPH|nr:SCP2 sterol-binding domain-containing protein [Roseibium sp. CAU 1639]MCK7611119.1 SCP2 sterol-binding domain-containing protein [Roseibium sp. CAU 1639]